MPFNLRSKNWRGPEKAVKEWRVDAAQQAAAGLEAVVFWSEAKATLGPLEELAETTRRKLAGLEAKHAEQEQVIEEAEAELERLAAKQYRREFEHGDLEQEAAAREKLKGAAPGMGARGKLILDARTDLQGMKTVLDLLRTVEPPPADVLPGLAEWLSLSR